VESGEAIVEFKCPHCQHGLKRKIGTKVEIEEGTATIRVRCMDGICPHCGKGMRIILCVGIEPMSEHEVRKDSELFRLAERIRRLLKIPI